MTILLQQANHVIPAGLDVNTFPIPATVKQPGVAMNVTVLMGAANFPTGTTLVQIELSQDGGVTFPFIASQSMDRPPAPRVGSNESLSFSLGVDDDPTHARVTTNAPTQFSTSVTITAT
jgi:hypothetical protein